MDKSMRNKESKETSKKANIDFNLCSWASLIVGLVVGVMLITFGTGRLIGYQSEMGMKTTEELSNEILELSDKYSDKEDERDEEFNQNGFSDEYLKLDEEAAELDEEITKLTNSRYMREEGWHNPRDIGEALTLAPEIIVGLVFLVLGIAGFCIFQRLKNKRVI